MVLIVVAVHEGLVVVAKSLSELLDFGLPIFKLNIDGVGKTWVTLWTGVV